MTANRPPTADELNGVKQDTVQWPAKAYRVTQTDSDGLEIDSTNPLPVSLSSDIEIGAVEIKDATTDERVNVTWDGFYSAMAVTDGRMVFNVDDNGIADSQIPQTTLDLNYGYDGTNAWVSLKVEFAEEVVLKAENDDKMTLTINDNLVKLIYLRVGAGARVEDRN